MKTKNRIFAIPADTIATPPNPNTAATNRDQQKDQSVIQHFCSPFNQAASQCGRCRSRRRSCSLVTTRRCVENEMRSKRAESDRGKKNLQSVPVQSDVTEYQASSTSARSTPHCTGLDFRVIMRAGPSRQIEAPALATHGIHCRPDCFTLRVPGKAGRGRHGRNLQGARFAAEPDCRGEGSGAGKDARSGAAASIHSGGAGRFRR